MPVKTRLKVMCGSKPASESGHAGSVPPNQIWNRSGSIWGFQSSGASMTPSIRQKPFNGGSSRSGEYSDGERASSQEIRKNATKTKRREEKRREELAFVHFTPPFLVLSQG